MEEKPKLEDNKFITYFVFIGMGVLTFYFVRDLSSIEWIAHIIEILDYIRE
jgi:hypothetical protein